MIHLKSEKKIDLISCFERAETLLLDLSKRLGNLGIKGADRAPVIVRKIVKPCSGFYTTVRFSPRLIIDVAAEGADITRRAPLIKPPFADSPLALETTERADISVREIVEFSPLGNPIMGFTPERRIDIPA
jgi:hypothetical protein